MMKEKIQENVVDDSKELVVIDYFDRIHNQWIKVEVTKEVARFLASSDKKIKRNDNRYYRHNISFEELFGNGILDDEKEQFLIDDSDEVEVEREKQERFEESLIDQQRTIIQNSLEHLPEKQKVVVDKILKENKSNQEIADDLKISKQSVSDRKLRAYKNIKKYLSDTQN